MSDTNDTNAPAKPFALQHWHQRQAAMLYHYASLDYLKGALERAHRVVAVAEGSLDEADAEGRDKYLVSEQWGVRDTAGNWSTHAHPFLIDLRQELITDIARRVDEHYEPTGYSYCARGLREYSMAWSTPEQEQEFDRLMGELGSYCSPIDKTLRVNRSSGWDGFRFESHWEDVRNQYPRLPKFRVRTDVEGESGQIPPRTGVYVPQDDPFGAVQFAWIGNRMGTIDGKDQLVAYGQLDECNTLDDLGAEAVRVLGWEGVFDWAPTEAAKARVLAYVRSRHLAAYEAQYRGSRTITPERLKNDPEMAYDFLWMYTKAQRPCKWYYVELVEGEYEDAEPPPPAGRGLLRAEPGQPVPQGGWWHTPALPGEQGFRRFAQGECLPETATSDWGAVIWHYDPERQPKAEGEAAWDPAELQAAAGRWPRAFSLPQAPRRSQPASEPAQEAPPPPAAPAVPAEGPTLAHHPKSEPLVSGRPCPVSGWWQCDEASLTVKGGRRQHFQAGQELPLVTLLGLRTLWQRLKGEQPEYTMQAVWTLVQPDEPLASPGLAEPAK